MLLRFLSQFLAVSIVIAQDKSIAEVERAFHNAKIPQDLDIQIDFQALLEVTFPQASGQSVSISAGMQLHRNETVNPPVFAIRRPSMRSSRLHSPFVVAMVDPDALTPQHPNEAQIRHILAGNLDEVHGSVRGTDPLRNTTPAISEFIQPAPPPGSDPHRYVFLLFEQPPGFDMQRIVTPSTPREHFNISEFAHAVDLGHPIAGSYMLVGPDSPTDP